MKAVAGIGEDFRPSAQFMKLNYISIILILVFAVLSWYVPLMLFLHPLINAIIIAVILAFFLPAFYWVPRYYESMKYRLTGNEITWRRGVWFRKTGVVPYNRITNVDIEQGPLSRALGISSLKIQTAGYSSPTKAAEIRIEGLENSEDMRERIMGFVRGVKPVAVETYDEGDLNSRILAELVRIRKLLGERR